MVKFSDASLKDLRDDALLNLNDYFRGSTQISEAECEPAYVYIKQLFDEAGLQLPSSYMESHLQLYQRVHQLRIDSNQVIKKRLGTSASAARRPRRLSRSPTRSSRTG